MLSRHRRLGACLALAGMLLGCSNPPAAGNRTPGPGPAPAQTLRVRLASQPAHLDPAYATSPSELAVVRQLNQPLLRPTPDLAGYEPAAAASYAISADGTVYIFHLRQNGRYGDGAPVRAQDFVLAWKRIIDPRTASPWAELFGSVTKGGAEAQSLDPKLDPGRLQAALDRLGIRAVDDLTLELTLPQPEGWAGWIATLPAGAPVRAELLAHADWAGHAASSIGNGPFSLAADPGTEVSLIQNASYWGGRPGLAALRFLVVTRDSDAVSLYQRGELDVAGTGLADPGRNRQQVRIQEPTVFWLDFNTSQPPFDNAGLRLALSQAIDRRALVEGPLQGRAAVAAGLLPGGGRPTPGSSPQQFNTDSARRQLEAAGSSRDQLGTLRLMVVDTLPDKAVAEFSALELKRNLGLNVTVEALAPAAYFKRLLAGDFQLAGPQGWTADYPDPQNWYDLFRSTDGRNRARWRNQRYDLLVRQADAEGDAGRRNQLYQQAELLLDQEAPAIFLEQRSSWALVRDRVRGAVRTGMDEWPGSLYAERIHIAQH